MRLGAWNGSVRRQRSGGRAGSGVRAAARCAARQRVAHAATALAAPRRINQLEKLEVLTLGANGGVEPGPDGTELTGISGTIPKELTDLTELVELDLQASAGCLTCGHVEAL